MRMAKLASNALGLFLACGLSAGTVALADGEGADGATPPPAADVKPAQDEKPTRQSRARDLQKSLEQLRDGLREAGKLDAETAKALNLAIRQAMELARPVRLDELTDEEREALEKALEAEAKRDGKKDGEQDDDKEDGDDSWGRFGKGLVDKALKGADLSEEEERGATAVISDWWKKAIEARADGDSKKSSDLKRERDDELEKLLGKKKSRKVINNLNQMAPGRR